MIDRGYDYFALGHVHTREVLSERAVDRVSRQFAGSPRARDRPQGCQSWSRVEGEQVRSVEHRALDAVRWHVAEADVSDEHSLDGVLERVRAIAERGRLRQ